MLRWADMGRTTEDRFERGGADIEADEDAGSERFVEALAAPSSSCRSKPEISTPREESVAMAHAEPALRTRWFVLR